MKLIAFAGLLTCIAVSPAYAGFANLAPLTAPVLELHASVTATSWCCAWSVPIPAISEQGGPGLPKLELIAHKLGNHRSSASAVALDNLGYKYQKGLGVGKDEAKARSLYQQAADAGLPSGIRNLGFMFANGLGGPKDLRQAAELYERASAAGDGTAANNLGLMYDDGRGVVADPAKAAELYQVAIRRGNVAAKYNLGLLYAKGNGFPKDLAKAMSLFREAARQGDAEAMYEVGLSYDLGRSVPVDFVQAAKWVAKSIAAGSEFALNEMNGNHNKWELPFLVALQKELASRRLYKGPTDGAWNDAMPAALRKLAGRA